MKSKLVLPPPVPPTPAPPAWPALYKHCNSDLVVLFTDINCGVVVVADRFHSLGESRGGWTPCTDCTWERLSNDAVVKLSNGS